METILPALRRLWLLCFAPTVALFLLAWLLTSLTGPCVQPATGVYILLVLLVVIFVGFAVTAFYFRRQTTEDKRSQDNGPALYTHAYRLRVLTLAALAALSDMAWVATHDTNCAYLVAILALILALLYPSRAFVIGRKTDNDQ